ncbi:MAG TPA: aldehyde dehydrogenase family protein [Syntrophobacteraceae bacterium]|nr:aldehyde dehydrogenase family protein [Syntrophobacteraceae bacterium]
MESSATEPFGCLIHGRLEMGAETYPVFNPSTGEVFARVTTADRSMVHRALESARESRGSWQRLPSSERADLLHRLAAKVREQADPLTFLLCNEVGKPTQSAREEVHHTAALLDFFAEESLRLLGRIPLRGYPGEQVLIVRMPVGVVVAITPFNYPLSTLACKMAPALGVGCTVVAKPDEHAPLSTLEMAKLALEVGFPPGVLNVVTGPGPEVGPLLVDHPIPGLIAFTGSLEVGRQVQAISARWVRKVVLELGGHCPAFVCHDADWPALLDSLVLQSLKNSGQYCYRPSQIFVDGRIYEDFEKRFIARAAQCRVGAAWEPDVDLGPLNNRELLAKVDDQVRGAVQEGAHLALGGYVPERPGFFYAPTVLTCVKPQTAIMQEDVFGPVVMLHRAEDMEAAVDQANASPHGLAAYLFTRDLGSAMEWASRIEAGSVWVNRIHQAYPEAPFGGMKQSGLGREKGHAGVEEFTELKTIYLSYGSPPLNK